MCPKDADGMANSIDPDQTTPLGAVWSGSTLFDHTCLSENSKYYGMCNTSVSYVSSKYPYSY